MRRSKEIMLLLALFIGMAAYVLWYVFDRRAKNQAAPPPPANAQSPAPAPPTPPPPDVALGGENERKTVDFSSGQPVVKDTPEDQAAMDAALKEMAEATKEVTFEPDRKPAETPPPAKP